jgi:hypothetical protein
MKEQKPLRTTGLIILALVFAICSVSCRRASEKTGEKMMEKAIENATGQKADVDLSREKAIIETPSGRIEADGLAKSWPAEIPDQIPEFRFGKITGVTTSLIDNQKTWTIVFDELQEGFIDKYDALLKEKGFETVTMKMGENAGSISVDNEKYTIFLMGGDGSLSLGISVKEQQ